MILILIIAVIFRIVDFVTGAEFVDLMKGTTIAFLSFNGIEHMTKAVKEFISSKVKGK